jgi:hypothetical protein
MKSAASTSNTEAAILARIIRAGEDTLAPEVARYLLSMRLTQGDEERVNELSAKAQTGSLSTAEEQELDSYLHVGLLLGVLQAKARGLLQQEPGSRRQ